MPLSKDMWLGSHAWGRVAVLGGLAAVLAAVFLALPGGAGAVPLKKAGDPPRAIGAGKITQWSPRVKGSFRLRHDVHRSRSGRSARSARSGAADRLTIQPVVYSNGGTKTYGGKRARHRITRDGVSKIGFQLNNRQSRYLRRQRQSKGKSSALALLRVKVEHLKDHHANKTKAGQRNRHDAAQLATVGFGKGKGRGREAQLSYNWRDLTLKNESSTDSSIVTSVLPVQCMLTDGYSGANGGRFASDGSSAPSTVATMNESSLWELNGVRLAPEGRGVSSVSHRVSDYNGVFRGGAAVEYWRADEGDFKAAAKPVNDRLFGPDAESTPVARGSFGTNYPFTTWLSMVNRVAAVALYDVASAQDANLVLNFLYGPSSAAGAVLSAGLGYIMTWYSGITLIMDGSCGGTTWVGITDTLINPHTLFIGATAEGGNYAETPTDPMLLTGILRSTYTQTGARYDWNGGDIEVTGGWPAGRFSGIGQYLNTHSDDAATTVSFTDKDFPRMVRPPVITNPQPQNKNGGYPYCGPQDRSYGDNAGKTSRKVWVKGYTWSYTDSANWQEEETSKWKHAGPTNDEITFREPWDDPNRYYQEGGMPQFLVDKIKNGTVKAYQCAILLLNDTRSPWPDAKAGVQTAESASGNWKFADIGAEGQLPQTGAFGSGRGGSQGNGKMQIKVNKQAAPLGYADRPDVTAPGWINPYVDQGHPARCSGGFYGGDRSPPGPQGSAGPGEIGWWKWESRTINCGSSSGEGLITDVTSQTYTLPAFRPALGLTVPSLPVVVE